MRSYFRYEDIQKRQFPQSPLQIEPKPLFRLPDTMIQRRKTAQVPFRKSLHQNRSPINFERGLLEELRNTNTQLNEVNAELAKLNESLQEQIVKLKENNKVLQAQVSQMSMQIDDLKINNRHLRSQDNSLHQQSKTFDQRLQDQQHHIASLQQQLRKLNDQLEEKKALEQKPLKLESAIQQLETLCLEMKNYILCKYCNSELREPVTVIPCAHSYCQSCKKGYMKECFLCGPEMEVEASYVNRFLIPILDLYKKNCEIKELLKYN